MSPGAGAGGVEAGGGAGTGAEGVEATGQAEEAGSSAGSMVTSSISTAHCSSGSSLTPAGAHCQAQGGVNAGVTQSETRAAEGAQAAASALSWTPPLLLSAELLTAVAKLLGWPEASGAPKAAGGPEATGGPQAGAIPAAGTASEVVAAAGHTPALSSADSPSTGSGAMPAAPLAPSPTIDHGCLLQLQQLLLPLLLPVSTSPAAQAGTISSAVEEPAAVETDAGAGAGAGSGSGSEQQSIPQVSRSLLNWLQDMQAAGHLQPLAAALSVPGCLGSRQTSQLLPLLSAVLTAAPPHVLTHTPATAPDNPATATATTSASPPAPVLALNTGLALSSALVPPSAPSGSGPAALPTSPLLSLLPLLRSDSGAQALLALLQAEQQRLEQTGLVEQAAAVCAASAATAAAKQLQRPPSPAAALGAEATSSHTQASPHGSASQPLAHGPPNLPTTLLHLAGMLQAAPATRSLAGLNVAAPGSSSSSSSRGSRPSAWPPLLLPLVLDLATALLPDFMEIKLVPRRTAPALPALAAPAPAALPLAPPVLAPPVLAPPVLAPPVLAPPALTAPTVPGALTLAAVPPAASPAVSTATAADAAP
ncbi:hypothetical protein QJQ45_016067 [Haematococcus lacustris]|nr:hypothetical protein QJQ45_016067 [Haematococcus lacustris]